MQENSTSPFWQEVFGNILQEPITVLFLFSLIIFWINDTIKQFKENGKLRGTYFSLIMFGFVIILPFSFIILTEFLALKAPERLELKFDTTLETLRWLTIFAVLCPLSLLITYKKSKFISTLFLCKHLIILLGGWLLGKWFGIFFMSVPILAIFYIRLYHAAQITFPSSTPENEVERKNKFWALFWYVWGLQYPVWFAKSSATRETEMRIGGDYFEDFGNPGIVWMHSHQVSGQSVGIEFEKVDGPGIIFTEQYERPDAIIDLRTQLRPVPFDAHTKDGIQIKAFIFISFKIDDEKWEYSRAKRHRILRASPILEKGFDLDRTTGSYPYSTARIHSALSTTSIESPQENNPSPKTYWDQIVVQHVIEKARLVLAERTFDELWFPKEDEIDEIINGLNKKESSHKDERNQSALDEIAKDINKKAVPRLEEIGVKLFASRVVNYIIDKDDPLRQQLVSTSLTEWQHKIEKIRLEGNIKAEELRMEAQSATRYAFLAAIKESLSRAREIDNSLPKQVVALNFVAALQGILQKTNKKDSDEKLASLETWKHLLLRNRERD